MRNLSCAFRIRLLNQVAVVAILAGATAACSGDVTRLREPLFTGSTPNQREIIGQNGGGASDTADLVQPGPSSGGVQSADLAPPPATPMTPAPIAVAPAPARPAVASNYVYQAAGGRVVTVGPGESLETLALKYGAPVAEIARANQIHSPADLKPGKVIVIPTRVAMAGPAVITPSAPEAYAPAAVGAPAQAEAACTIPVPTRSPPPTACPAMPRSASARSCASLGPAIRAPRSSSSTTRRNGKSPPRSARRRSPSASWS
jgi:LysM repeat protein